jgi:hypothetical protein
MWKIYSAGPGKKTRLCVIPKILRADGFEIGAYVVFKKENGQWFIELATVPSQQPVRRIFRAGTGKNTGIVTLPQEMCADGFDVGAYVDFKKVNGRWLIELISAPLPQPNTIQEQTPVQAQPTEQQPAQEQPQPIAQEQAPVQPSDAPQPDQNV